LWFSEKFTKSQAWIDLFLNANHAEGSFWIRGIEIKLKRGQLGWSELTMAKGWRWSRNKTRMYLKWLEKEQQIEQQKSSQTTILTILNYNNHQTDEKTIQQTEQQKDNRRNTNNNDKKNKNDKNVYTTDFEEFWNVYPRKEKKYDTFLIWSRLKPNAELQKTMLNSVKALKLSDDWIKNGGKYIPHPSTYLNGRRWEDEVKKTEEDLLWNK